MAHASRECRETRVDSVAMDVNSVLVARSIQEQDSQSFQRILLGILVAGDDGNHHGAWEVHSGERWGWWGWKDGSMGSVPNRRKPQPQWVVSAFARESTPRHPLRDVCLVGGFSIVGQWRRVDEPQVVSCGIPSHEEESDVHHWIC